MLQKALQKAEERATTLEMQACASKPALMLLLLTAAGKPACNYMLGDLNGDSVWMARVPLVRLGQVSVLYRKCAAAKLHVAGTLLGCCHAQMQSRSGAATLDDGEGGSEGVGADLSRQVRSHEETSCILLCDRCGSPLPQADRMTSRCFSGTRSCLSCVLLGHCLLIELRDMLEVFFDRK